MKKIAGAAVLAVLIAGCGGSGSHHYATNLETNYLNACESSGGDTGQCQCSLDWFEKRLSQTQFEAVEDEMRSGSLPATAREAIAACR